MAKRLSKIKIKNHQNIHAKTYNDRNSKPQQKHHLGTVSNSVCVCGGGGGGLNRFNVVTTLALSSAVVYTKHLLSPREGFLTHQCNILENKKKKKKKKKSNEYRDETTMRTRQQEITEILKQMNTNSWTPVGLPASILRQSTSGRHRPVSYPDGPMTARYRFT